jgi:integrase/recombinase XerD
MLIQASHGAPSRLRPKATSGPPPHSRAGREHQQDAGFAAVRMMPRRVRHSQLHGDREPAQCQDMMNFTDLASVPSHPLAPFTSRLRRAVAACLARFTGISRTRTESDLRCYLAWCAEHGLDRWPPAARTSSCTSGGCTRSAGSSSPPSPAGSPSRPGFYRTCVLDGVLEHSPAENVRRPSVPAESPTLGFTHLQFEALLTAARQSPNPRDFALVAMLGLLGLRIFEATSADIADLGEEHGHRVLRVCGKGTKVVLVPLPPAVGRAIDRAAAARVRGPILLNTRGACATSPELPASR